MAIKPIKLTELIERGRQSPSRPGGRSDDASNGSVRRFATGGAETMPAFARGGCVVEHAIPYFKPTVESDAETLSVTDGIELLAITLLAIKRRRSDNPKTMLVEALQSIDECLVAIREGQRIERHTIKFQAAHKSAP